MELLRSLGILTGSLSLVFLLTALSTDFWFVATGPGFTLHSGLWPKEFLGYIQATRALSILAAVFGLVSVIFLIVSFIPALSLRGYAPLFSCIMAFSAAIFAVVAMVVYTSERWEQSPHPQIQTYFSWSFYLGWVSAVLWLCTGTLSLGVHCTGPRSGYDTL